MRIAALTLTAICCACSGTDVPNPNGHYVLESTTQLGRYLTLDVEDSVVLLNKSLIFRNQRDTIFIDPRTKTFRSAVANEFDIYEFKSLTDTVILSFGEKGSGSEMIFVRSGVDPQRDIFSNSFLDVQLNNCEGSCVNVPESDKIRHLLIGPPKPGIADRMMVSSDSIIMEFHNMAFISLKDIAALTREMKKAGEHLCVHFDKETPKEHVISLRAELSKHAQGMTVLEGRMMNGRVVFVQLPAGQSATL